MTRCGRQDNIDFDQRPIPDSPKLANGEHSLYHLTLGCRECGESILITPANGKTCQWWINIARIRHDSCHLKDVVAREKRNAAN